MIQNWFLYWIIPSIISFLFSFIMLFHLICYTLILKYIFSLLYFLITLFELFQIISLLFQCQIRIILFQFCLLYKSFLSLLIISMITFIIKFKLKFQKYLLYLFIIIIFFICIIFNIILYYYNTYEIFCSYHDENGYVDNISEVSNITKIIYFSLFYIPSILSVVIIIILSLYNLRQLKLQGYLSNPYLIPLLRRLQWYPLIIAGCNLPSIIMIAQLLLTNTTSILLMDIGGCALSSTGIFISILYLYYTCCYTAPYAFSHSIVSRMVSSKKSSYNSSVVSDYSNTKWTIGRNGGFFRWSVGSSTSSSSINRLAPQFNENYRDNTIDEDSLGASTTPSTHLLEDYRRDYEDYYFPRADEPEIDETNQLTTGHGRENSTSIIPFYSKM